MMRHTLLASAVLSALTAFVAFTHGDVEAAALCMANACAILILRGGE